MVTRSINEKGKKKDIAELIRLITLHPEQLEPNVSMFVQRAIVNARVDANLEETTSFINQRIRNDIEKLLVPFDEMFSHDEIILLISFYKEIKLLIGFYKSEAMKKFSKNGEKLFGPLYETYFHMIKEAQNQL